ncbi:MAG: hypothetical protein RLZZ370_1001 [Bacteroidota bacterium]|jgi:tRNA threonylcarbamoyladenosine biosynthesis protein TsaB
MMEPLILCIESSDRFCSVALFEGDRLLAVERAAAPLAHAERLAPMVDKIIRDFGRTPSAVALSKGPGSYTGLRIGASMAKGLCFGWNVPLLSIDTLQALAWNMREEAAWAAPSMLVPMTDARRMEVYTAVYESQELNTVIPVAPKILEPDDFLELAGEYQLVFAGSGAAKWQQLCRWSDKATFFPELLPDATGMGALAADAFRKGQFVDVAYFEPFYLKQFLPGKGSVA